MRRNLHSRIAIQIKYCILMGKRKWICAFVHPHVGIAKMHDTKYWNARHATSSLMRNRASINRQANQARVQPTASAAATNGSLLSPSCHPIALRLQSTNMYPLNMLIISLTAYSHAKCSTWPWLVREISEYFTPPTADPTALRHLPTRPWASSSCYTEGTRCNNAHEGPMGYAQ